MGGVGGVFGCYAGDGSRFGLFEWCCLRVQAGFWAAAWLVGFSGSALTGGLLLPVAAKVTKNACPAIRPYASLRVRSLHRRTEGRLTRAVPGPLSLSPHPCGSPLYATIPLTLLKGRLALPESFADLPMTSSRSVETTHARSAKKNHSATRSPSPRQEAEWRCCAGGREAGRRARSEGAGTSLRDGPRSGTGRREVWRRSRQTRMSGCPSLWLLSLGQTRESNSP